MRNDWALICLRWIEGNRLCKTRALGRTLLKYIHWEPVHTCIWQVSFAGQASPNLIHAGFMTVWLLVGVNIISLLSSKTNQTLYERLAGSFGVVSPVKHPSRTDHVWSDQDRYELNPIPTSIGNTSSTGARHFTKLRRNGDGYLNFGSQAGGIHCLALGGSVELLTFLRLLQKRFKIFGFLTVGEEAVFLINSSHPLPEWEMKTVTLPQTPTGVKYCTNHHDFWTMAGDMNLYFPRFVRLINRYRK